MTPRFGISCEPSYDYDGPTGHLVSLTVRISNGADVPHSIDELFARFDDGRVSLGLPYDPVTMSRIGPGKAVSVVVPATSLAAPAGAARVRIVVSSGKQGQRKEWTSKEEALVQHGPVAIS